MPLISLAGTTTSLIRSWVSSKQDSFRLYLAYHEGHGGYRKQSYRDKDWLIDVARKVDRQAQRYNAQLQECAEELEPRGWFDWW